MWAILVFHSFIVKDTVTRQCPQTTTFEAKGEPKRIRTEAHLLTSLTPYRLCTINMATLRQGRVRGKEMIRNCRVKLTVERLSVFRMCVLIG